MDIIIGNNVSSSSTFTEVWLNTGTTGSPTFAFSAGLDNNTGGGKNSIAVGDINGDGAVDIITGSSSFAAELFLNNGNTGSFTQATAPGGYSGGVRLVDWDHDGMLDYLNFDAYNNHGLEWRKGYGNGTFAATSIILAQTGVSNNAYLGDLNEDGFLDAVLDHWGGNAFVFLSNGCTLTQQNSCNYTLGHSDGGNALDDFNGDGSLDVFCGGRSNSSSFWMNYLTPVTAPALPNITVNNGLVSAGQSFTITPSGATTYTYSSGSPVVSPVTTTVYTITGANANGCTSTKNDTVFIKGAALNFNGTNNTVDLGMGITNALVGGNQITIEAWVAPTNTVSVGTIVNNHQNTTQFLLGIDSSKYNFFIGFGAFSVKTPAGVVTPGSWQHVAGVYNGSSIKIYINGVLSGTTAVSSFTFPSSGTTTKLGSDAFGEYFNGSMDEVRIWKRALCKGEIMNSMNTELKLPQTNLLAYYTFNEGISGANNSTVTILADSSGNSYTGTLSNFVLTGNTSNWIAPGGVITGSYSPTFVYPTVTVNSPTICVGATATLTASGTATTYSWSTTATTASITATPTITANYTVTGADINNCMTTTTSTVTVNSLPTVTASSNTVSLCVGSTATLTAGGTATSYTWSTGATTASIAVSPTMTATYTAAGANVNGCTNMATVTQTVITCSTGIDRVTGSNEVNIYPNPSNGTFNLTISQFDNSKTNSVEIYNTLGQLVLSKPILSNTESINLESLNQGVYILRVIQNNSYIYHNTIILNK